MAITTLKVNRFKHTPIALLLTGTMLSAVPHDTFAQQNQVGFDVSAVVRTELIQQNVESDTLASQDLTTFSLRPQVTLSYQSSKVRGAFTSSVTHLERESETANQEQTFSEYTYSAQAELIDNVLGLGVNGALNFQNGQAGNFLVNDFVNDQGQLRRVRSNTVSLFGSSQNGDWIRGSGTASYTKVEAERNEVLNNQALDSDIYAAQGQLRQGDEINGVVFSLTGLYRNVDQNQASNLGDFKTRFVRATTDILLLGNWGLRFEAQHEANQISSLNNNFVSARSFNSYGAGITYYRSENRFLSVTYNTTEADIESQDGEGFIGVDLNWAFSARTSIAARYTRRFFGDSGLVSLRYNTKRLRSSLSYTEQVTTNSILQSSIQSLGTFVCPIGASQIGSCFQPDSLNFELDPGQEFAQFNQLNLEVNDNVILRKANNAQLGYSFSRLDVTLFSVFSEEIFLDADAERRSLSGGMALSYELGVHTSVNARFTYADIEAQGTTNSQVGGFFAGDSENTNASIGLSRRIGQRLSTNANFVYLNRTGNNINRAFGSNFTDRRITLGLSYIFE
jgi:uncharacterized protein (PEP-CTERM system associated)